MIGDLKREFTDSSGLGMKVEKDPLQISDLNTGTLYIMGESTIEVYPDEVSGHFLLKE